MRCLRYIFIVICVSFVYGKRDQNSNYQETNLSDSGICDFNDPNVAACIRSKTEEARHLLAAGVPSIGIQPLEPLKVPSIRLRQHNMPKNKFQYDAWLSDIMLKGLTNYTFNALEIFPEDLKLTGNISLPRMEMIGEYVVLGEFQMLPVESTGKLSANFTMCTAALEAQGARVHRRMVIKDATVRLCCINQLQAHLDAHSTTREMEMVTDHIAMMHAEQIIQEIQPAVETSLAMVLEDVANKFLKHVSPKMVFSN